MVTATYSHLWQLIRQVLITTIRPVWSNPIDILNNNLRFNICSMVTPGCLQPLLPLPNLPYCKHLEWFIGNDKNKTKYISKSPYYVDCRRIIFHGWSINWQDWSTTAIEAENTRSNIFTVDLWKTCILPAVIANITQSWKSWTQSWLSLPLKKQ